MWSELQQAKDVVYPITGTPSRQPQPTTTSSKRKVVSNARLALRRDALDRLLAQRLKRDLAQAWRIWRASLGFFRPPTVADAEARIEQAIAAVREANLAHRTKLEDSTELETAAEQDLTVDDDIDDLYDQLDQYAADLDEANARIRDLEDQLAAALKNNHTLPPRPAPSRLLVVCTLLAAARSLWVFWTSLAPVRKLQTRLVH